MENDKLIAETEYLFGRIWGEDISEEAEEEYTNRADNLIKEYGWQEVFRAWNEYLHTKCTTPESVVNFANLYWSYCGDEYPIPDPHKFIAYLYYMTGNKLQHYYNGEIIENLATKILRKAGYSEADRVLNPYYIPDQDPKILAEVEAIRQHHA